MHVASINLPSSTRQRGVFRPHSTGEPGGVNPRILRRKRKPAIEQLITLCHDSATTEYYSDSHRSNKFRFASVRNRFGERTIRLVPEWNQIEASCPQRSHKAATQPKSSCRSSWANRPSVCRRSVLISYCLPSRSSYRQAPPKSTSTSTATSTAEKSIWSTESILRAPAFELKRSTQISDTVRKQRIVSPNTNQKGEPGGNIIVAWASARAIRSDVSPTRERGIFNPTNQTTTNRNNTKKSRQGRQIIAQRFYAGLQATAKRQVPPEVNHPSPKRERGIFSPHSPGEPGGVNPRMLRSTISDYRLKTRRTKPPEIEL